MKKRNISDKKMKHLYIIFFERPISTQTQLTQLITFKTNCIMAENKKTQDQTENTTNVTVEVKIHSSIKHNERCEKKNAEAEPELVPVSETEKDFTINFELSAEKVKNFMKIIGEGVGDYVKEKIAGEE